MRKPIFLVAFLAATSLVFSANRVGPVSQYGQLMAGKNSNGKGQIYGSCPSWSTSGHEVSVQGMSLFWSIGGDVSVPYWSKAAIDKLVSQDKIELIRAAVGIDEDWSGTGQPDNYETRKDYYQGLLNTVIEAAINNDIYVLIDFHSHHAENHLQTAIDFFRLNAEKWGKYDNVIFELYNEPIGNGYDEAAAKAYWPTIKGYAETLITEIRKYSDNLIVVGTPYYDMYPNVVVENPINATNIAYTFHYYAGEDPYRHKISEQGTRAVKAMNAGYSLFVTEWGNSAPTGDGGFTESYSKEWYDWMVSHKLSGANWSVCHKNETASYYTDRNGTLSQSGSWTKNNVFANNPATYTACNGALPASSASNDPTSSSSLAEGYTNVIDDMEDLDGRGNTGGIWYAYTDVDNDGQSTIGNDKVKNDYVVVFPSAEGNSTKGVAGLKSIVLNQGGNKYDPYVAITYAFNEKQTDYDLSKCTAVSYKYMGAAHTFKVEISPITNYDFHAFAVSPSTTWKDIRIPMDYLMQEGWSDDNLYDLTKNMTKVTKFSWEIKGGNPTPNYLYIDDIVCEGLSFKKVETARSSSSAKSSSSSKPSSSSAVPVSSASAPISSSSFEQPALTLATIAPLTKVMLSGRTLQISGASAHLQIFDMQGRPLMTYHNVRGEIDLSSIPVGNYVVRYQQGAIRQIGKISLK